MSIAPRCIRCNSREHTTREHDEGRAGKQLVKGGAAAAGSAALPAASSPGGTKTPAVGTGPTLEQQQQQQQQRTFTFQAALATLSATAVKRGDQHQQNKKGKEASLERKRKMKVTIVKHPECWKNWKATDSRPDVIEKPLRCRYTDPPVEDMMKRTSCPCKACDTKRLKRQVDMERRMKNKR